VGNLVAGLFKLVAVPFDNGIVIFFVKKCVELRALNCFRTGFLVVAYVAD